jgi:hypothetical protein
VLRVSGEGVRPLAEVNPRSLDFGTQQVRTSSNAQVTITNTGTDALRFDGLTIAGSGAADFGIMSETCTPRPIAVGAFCQIDMLYLPRSAGPSDATLMVRTDDPSGVLGLTLAGKSVIPPQPRVAKGSVSINSGNTFTRLRHVKLFMITPPETASVLVANDGGFLLGARELPASPTQQYEWNLDTPLPVLAAQRVVYVRFLDAAKEVITTASDDITLDDRAPRLLSLSASAAGAGAARVKARRRTRLRIVASEDRSGLVGAQVSSNKRSPGRLRPLSGVSSERRTGRFQGSVVVASTAARLFVRVIDGAGNVSRWRTAR